MDDKNNVLADFLKNVDELQINALSVSKELLDDGTPQAVVVLEKKRAMPERMESPARAHRFYDVPGFVAYIFANKTGNTLVLADVKNTVISAVLDDKASKGFETVQMRPAYYPEFEMLAGILGQKMGAARFAEQMVLNRGVLGEDAKESRQLAILWQQLTVSSKIEAAVGSGKTAVNGVMCTTKVSSGSGHDVVELPDNITVRTPIFVNRPVCEFQLVVTVLANSQGDVLIQADAPEIEVLKYKEIREMAAEVEKALSGDGDVQVTVGSGRYENWHYNK